jgi:hypothetical protein
MIMLLMSPHPRVLSLICVMKAYIISISLMTQYGYFYVRDYINILKFLNAFLESK